MKKKVLIILICILTACVFFVFKDYTLVKKSHIDDINSQKISLEADIRALEKKLEEAKNKDDKNMHPIEIKVQKCMKEKNYTTSGMILCVDSSHKDWYIEIDKNMELLKQVLTKDEYALLEISQKEWIEYKNSELKTIGAIFGFGPPEMVRFFRSGEQAGIIEDRAKALGGYYEVYNAYKY